MAHEDRQESGTGWPEPAGAGDDVTAHAAAPEGTAPPKPAPEPRAPEPDAPEPDVREPDAAEVDVPEPEPDLAEPEVDEAAGPELDEAAGPEVDEAAGPVLAGWRPRRPRVSVAGGVIGALLVLLGFALVVQLRSNASDNQLTTARSEDLVRILSELDARKDRLSQEITSLDATKQQLEAGSEGRAAALAEASRRAEELGILAGTLAAQGPGLTVRLMPGSQPLKAWLILDAVEELRGAGAEAMQIAGSSGAPVRIVASTYFVDAGTGLRVDGQTLAPPYVITVIGDPQAMQPALNIAGGVADTVHQATGTVIVEQGTVRVTATHATTTPRYAQPVS